MLNDRDFNVIDFLTKYKIARTSTLCELFYPSLRVTQRRLKKMTEVYDLKRERYTIADEYIYYFKRPKQFLHDLLLTDLYRELHKRGNVVYFDKEFRKIEGIRPDALMGYEQEDKKYLFFVEIEISKKGLDMGKYRKIYTTEEYKKVLPVFPTILVVSNRKFRGREKFEVLQTTTKMELDFLAKGRR